MTCEEIAIEALKEIADSDSDSAWRIAAEALEAIKREKHLLAQAYESQGLIPRGSRLI